MPTPVRYPRLMTRLDEISARLEAASPRPWSYSTVDSIGGGALYDATRTIASLHHERPEDHNGRIVRHLLEHEADANGDLMAHAPTDLAALVAVVRAVQATNDRYMKGEVPGIALSLDIHTALTELENS